MISDFVHRVNIRIGGMAVGAAVQVKRDDPAVGRVAKDSYVVPYHFLARCHREPPASPKGHAIRMLCDCQIHGRNFSSCMTVLWGDTPSKGQQDRTPDRPAVAHRAGGVRRNRADLGMGVPGTGSRRSAFGKLAGPPRSGVRAEAGLGDVRIHDLRHAYASFGLRQGESVPVIARLRGHRSAETTLKCTRFADMMVREAAATVGAVLETGLFRAVLSSGQSGCRPHRAQGRIHDVLSVALSGRIRAAAQQLQQLPDRPEDSIN